MKNNNFILLCLCFLMIVSFGTGCTGEQARDPDNPHQLNLNTPQMEGRTVTVNGGIMVPIERIQWQWGDGQTDPHHYFPASHTYTQAGQYMITVTVFDAKGFTSTNSSQVDVK